MTKVCSFVWLRYTMKQPTLEITYPVVSTDSRTRTLVPVFSFCWTKVAVLLVQILTRDFCSKRLLSTSAIWVCRKPFCNEVFTASVRMVLS